MGASPIEARAAELVAEIVRRTERRVEAAIAAAIDVELASLRNGRVEPDEVVPPDVKLQSKRCLRCDYFGWYTLNVLELAPHVIAIQLGHRDGGKLIRTNYGHPDAAIARERVREAFERAPAAPVPLVARGT